MRQPTNILALPLTHLTVETGNNEDWVDILAYVTIDQEQPVDLRGIDFDMQVRRRASDHDVMLHASTANRMIRIGDNPNWNQLIIHVPLSWVKQSMIGYYIGEYVADVLAHDDQFRRVCITMDLRVVHGVTR